MNDDDDDDNSLEFISEKLFETNHEQKSIQLIHFTVGSPSNESTPETLSQDICEEEIEFEDPHEGYIVLNEILDMKRKVRKWKNGFLQSRKRKKVSSDGSVKARDTIDDDVSNKSHPLPSPTSAKLQKTCASRDTPKFSPNPNQETVKLPSSSGLLLSPIPTKLQQKTCVTRDQQKFSLSPNQGTVKLPSSSGPLSSPTSAKLQNSCALRDKPKFSLSPNQGTVKLPSSSPLLSPTSTKLQKTCGSQDKPKFLLSPNQGTVKLPSSPGQLSSPTSAKLQKTCVTQDKPKFSLSPNQGTVKIPSSSGPLSSPTSMKLLNTCGTRDKPKFSLNPNQRTVKLLSYGQLSNPSSAKIQNACAMRDQQKFSLSPNQGTVKLPSSSGTLSSPTSAKLQNTCATQDKPEFSISPNEETVKLPSSGLILSSTSAKLQQKTCVTQDKPKFSLSPNQGTVKLLSSGQLSSPTSAKLQNTCATQDKPEFSISPNQETVKLPVSSLTNNKRSCENTPSRRIIRKQGHPIKLNGTIKQNLSESPIMKPSELVSIFDNNHNGLPNPKPSFHSTEELECVNEDSSNATLNGSVPQVIPNMSYKKAVNGIKTINSSPKSNGNKKFKCVKCQFSSYYFHSLKRHNCCFHSRRENYKKLAFHFKCSKFKCSKCAFVARENKDLKKHQILVHNKKGANVPVVDKLLTCSQCPYTTLLPKNLNAHLSTHSESNFNCILCDYKSQFRSSFRRHRIVHYHIERLKQNMRIQNRFRSKLLRCLKCGFRTKLKRNLLFHELRHSKAEVPNDAETTVSSIELDRTLEESKLNLSESNAMNPEGLTALKKSLSCKLVHSSGSAESENMTLTASINESCNKVKLNDCTFCKFSSKTPAGLRRHMRKNHEPSDSPGVKRKVNKKDSRIPSLSHMKTKGTSDLVHNRDKTKSISHTPNCKENVPVQVQKHSVHSVKSDHGERIKNDRLKLSEKSQVPKTPLKKHHTNSASRVRLKSSSPTPNNKDVNYQNKVYSCQKCKYTSHVKAQLVIHKRSHKMAISATNPKCKSATPSREKLPLKSGQIDLASFKQAQTESGNERIPTKRERCNRKMSSKRQLESETEFFTCSHCAFTTLNYNRWTEHIEKFHSSPAVSSPVLCNDEDSESADVSSNEIFSFVILPQAGKDRKPDIQSTPHSPLKTTETKRSRRASTLIPDNTDSKTSRSSFSDGNEETNSSKSPKDRRNRALKGRASKLVENHSRIKRSTKKELLDTPNTNSQTINRQHLVLSLDVDDDNIEKKSSKSSYDRKNTRPDSENNSLKSSNGENTRANSDKKSLKSSNRKNTSSDSENNSLKSCNRKNTRADSDKKSLKSSNKKNTRADSQPSSQNLPSTNVEVENAKNTLSKSTKTRRNTQAPANIKHDQYNGKSHKTDPKSKNVDNTKNNHDLKSSKNVDNTKDKHDLKSSKNVHNTKDKHDLKSSKNVHNTKDKHDLKSSKNVVDNTKDKPDLKSSKNVHNTKDKHDLKSSKNVHNTKDKHDLKSSKNVVDNTKDKPDLKSSKNVHNTKGKQIHPYTCNLCGYKADCRPRFEDHQYNHEKEKKLACKYCSYYKTNRRRNLKQHEKIHLRETRFSCPLCDYETSNEGLFKGHVSRHGCL